MKKATIEIWGGFHNAPAIRLQIDPADVPTHSTESAGWILEPGILTNNQCARLSRHMCGISGCMCGLHHGSQWAQTSYRRGCTP
jgi:hypothetical protein